MLSFLQQCQVTLSSVRFTLGSGSNKRVSEILFDKTFSSQRPSIYCWSLGGCVEEDTFLLNTDRWDKRRDLYSANEVMVYHQSHTKLSFEVFFRKLQPTRAKKEHAGQCICNSLLTSPFDHLFEITCSLQLKIIHMMIELNAPNGLTNTLKIKVCLSPVFQWIHVFV